jgi:imidazolonepropionase-like amidohydrolase
MKTIRIFLLSSLITLSALAQETFPVNGVTDIRSNYFAFTGATIIKDPQTTLENATLIIQDGKIVSVGVNMPVPAGAVAINCKGKMIYPSFIDLYSDYGIPAVARGKGGGGNDFQNVSNTNGAYAWNQALKPETDASKLFTANEDKAKGLRNIGFGAVLAHQQDGIARGSGTLVSLGNERDNLVMIKEKAATFYSFSKGVSTQDYPTSLMGSIALLRQTYYDAKWYKNRPSTEGINLSLEAWNENMGLPQIFDAGDKWNDLRCSKIANEFGVQYIVKGGGNEYQRMDEMKASKLSFILPVNFPPAMDIEDVNDARVVALSVLKHWEMAPLQPGMFEKSGIQFALTASGLKSNDDFMTNLRKAIDNGLSVSKALESLTKTPALLIGQYDLIGSLDAGKIANFMITSGPVFDEKTIIYQNWVQGKKYVVSETGWNDYRGNYKLTVNDGLLAKEYNVEVKGTPQKISLTIQPQGDTIRTDGAISVNEKLVRLNWTLKKDSSKTNSLTGIIDDQLWSGNGLTATGGSVLWTMSFISPYVEKADTSKKPAKTVINDTVLYPFKGFGWTVAPKQEDMLIKNATVWTNEKEGIITATDVYVKNGKIAAIGKNLNYTNVKIIDGTGMHLSPGIIDEHSHIAIYGGVNECSQSVTAEVRVGDVIDPDDITIYRQLSGGVTSAHLLHGSCNTIGGQTQLIKLRWGQDAEALKFMNWDPFIKFALGENVKRTYYTENKRFPDTRMGVQQVLMDAFTRARDYEAMGPGRRRDLELDALVAIMHQKLFITCHSYIQSEINMLMFVADTFGFKVNTFTHILEGYKVADKMKARGANASTFSDWWAYKSEVMDAIPYNAAIMDRVGLTVAVNSDDPEQARHLNQEAAKSIRYGNLSEEEAFKMCTLNPAKMLHVSDRVGSIRVGKDADLVLWTDNPLSVYAKPSKTIVDGTIYYDSEKDAVLRKQLEYEKNILIQKVLNAKKGGTKTTPAILTPGTVDDSE